MVSIEVKGATDQGRVRARNEDSFYVGEWIFAVADGLGGHPAGDVASATAIDVLKELDATGTPDDPRKALVTAIHEAHEHIVARGNENPEQWGMGTTLTAVAVQDNELHLAHVGDSRCYLLRDGELSQQSVDHTPVQLAVDAGTLDPAEAPHHPERHVLAQALGLEEGIDVDTRGGMTLQAGDRVLLCSDGLTEMVPDRDISRLLDSEDEPQKLCQALIGAALDAGGVDNITTVVLVVA